MAPPIPRRAQAAPAAPYPPLLKAAHSARVSLSLKKIPHAGMYARFPRRSRPLKHRAAKLNRIFVSDFEDGILIASLDGVIWVPDIDVKVVVYDVPFELAMLEACTDIGLVSPSIDICKNAATATSFFVVICEPPRLVSLVALVTKYVLCPFFHVLGY